MSTVQGLRITLQSDIIFSDRPKTEGGHETRPYIPGSALLGAAAGKLYSEFQTAGVSFDVFHSGKVRFMNAYPEIAPHPMPLCLYREKGEDHGPAMNFLRYSKEELRERAKNGKQDKQLRSGFISETDNDGRTELTMKSLFRMKTAIDRTTFNRSAESQLFGYEALPAGSVWIGAIEFGDGIGNDVQDRIIEALTATPLRMGKSRTAEYGAVRIEKAKQQKPAASGDEQGPAIFYCRSDVALTDPDTGMPTVIPASSCFKLPKDAEFKPEQSFIRTRTYAPYNRTRKSFDTDRYVIAAGSVIVFHLISPLSADLGMLCSTGIGDHLGEGLGEVIVNPVFLKNREVKLKEGKVGSEAVQKKSSEEVLKACPDNALRTLLADRFKRIARSDDFAYKHADLFEDLYKQPVPLPGKSQWSNVRQAAVISRDRKQLTDALFGEKGICTHGVRQAQWNAEVRKENIDFSLADYLGVLVQEPEELAKRIGPQKISALQDFSKKLHEKKEHKPGEFVKYEPDFVRVREMLMIIGRTMAERRKEAR